MHKLTYIWVAGGYKESQGVKFFIEGGFPFLDQFWMKLITVTRYGFGGGLHDP